MTFFRPGEATDSIYKAIRDCNNIGHERARQYLETLWEHAATHIDEDAADKAKRDLPSVFWEMELAHVMKSAGFDLALRRELSYQDNKGPDLFIKDAPGTWIEAITVRAGEGLDALEYPKLGHGHLRNTGGLVLRFSSAIRDKRIKIQGYIDEGIIKDGQAVVIAISSACLPYNYLAGIVPEIVGAVYPVGHPVIEIDTATNLQTGWHAQYRENVYKRSGAPVPTTPFLDPSFSRISAVILGQGDWANPAEIPGANYTLVHNATAQIPLRDGWLSSGLECWWRMNEGAAKLEMKMHGR